MIRSKFYCSEVAKVANQQGTTETERVRMAPVYGDENKPWSQYTPCGSFEIHITNPDAMGKLEPGKVYFIDVTPAAEG